MLAEMHNDASGIVFGMFSYSIMQSTSLIQWNTEKNPDKVSTLNPAYFTSHKLSHQGISILWSGEWLMHFSI